MLILTTLLMGLAAFGWATVRFGADSRPTFDERPDGERFGALR